MISVTEDESCMAAAINFLEGGAPLKSSAGNIYHPSVFSEGKTHPSNLLIEDLNIRMK